MFFSVKKVLKATGKCMYMQQLKFNYGYDYD